MERRSDPRRHHPPTGAQASDGEPALYEVRARDEWQADLITCDGARAGTVVRKVVEPAAYMVRYLVVYRPDEGRHLLVPAGAVTGGEGGEIHVCLPRHAIDRLPTYAFARITRAYEQAVYDAAGLTPHWEEERTH